MMCECGDTLRGPCPRCEARIDAETEAREHPGDDRLAAAETRYERSRGW